MKLTLGLGGVKPLTFAESLSGELDESCLWTTAGLDAGGAGFLAGGRAGGVLLLDVPSQQNFYIQKLISIPYMSTT